MPCYSYWNAFENHFFLIIANLLYSIYSSGLTYRCILTYIFINYAIVKAFPIDKFILNSPASSLYKIKYVNKMVKSHRQIREEINSLLGFIPLITLSLTFLFSITHFTILINEKYSSEDGDIYLWVEYCVLLGINILMTITLGQFLADNHLYLKIIEWISHQIKKEQTVLSRNKVEQVQLDDSRQVCILYLNSLINNPIQHNACDILIIDRKFLMHFIASLIPFCVMSIQMYQTK